MAKKRKLSGLSGVELSVAYHSLLALKETLKLEVVDEVTPASQTETGSTGDEERFLRPMDTLLFWMEKKLERPQPYNFAGVDAEVLTQNLHLQQWGIRLTAKPHESRVEDISALQPQHIWSSENLHRHLTWLEQLVPKMVEASARSWIDAFFFRASALVSEGKRMVMNMEHTIPTTRVSPTALTTLAGQIDYSAIVAEKDIAETILMDPQMLNVCRIIKAENAVAAEPQESTSSTARLLPTGFFVVVEAKPEGGRVVGHLPQAVSEMYACATLLERKFLRGALTNGHEWIFIIIRVNQDAPGGKFQVSSPLTLYVSEKAGEILVDKSSADRIAAVLSYWIEHSFEDIGDDDWFEPVTWD